MGQIRALANKNWIIYRRNVVGSILEILVPVGFMLFLILTRYLAKIDTFK